MSNDIIKEFLVACGFKVDETQYKKFVGGIEAATVKVAALGAATVAMAAVIVHEVDKVADKFNDLKNVSNRIKAPVEEIEEWQYVAELTGSTKEASVASMEGLARASGMAALGMKRTLKIFKAIGVSIYDNHHKLKDTSRLLEDIQDSKKFQSMGQNEKLATLGRLGIAPSMIRALTEDTKPLRKEFADLMNAAGIDGNKAADKAQQYHNQMLRLHNILDVIWESVSLKIMDKLAGSLDEFVAKARQYLPEIISTLTPVVKEVIDLGAAFLKLGLIFLKIIKPILEGLQWLDKQTNGWSSSVLALLFVVSRFVALATAATWVLTMLSKALAFARAAVLIFNIALYANPLVWIIALIVAVIALIAALGYGIYRVVKDFQHWRETGKSAMSGLWNSVAEFYGNFMKGLHFLEDKVIAFWNKIKGLAKIVGDFFSSGDHKNISANLSKTTNVVPLVGQGVNQHVSQDTKIYVTGTDNPAAVGREVANQQSRVNSDMTRNMAGVVR